MSYTKRDGITAGADEAVVELDDGTLVAVQCTQSTIGGRIQYEARARAINSDGAAITNAAGELVESKLKHSDANTTRAAAVTRDCLLAVLGETPETVAWGAQYLLDVSIRQALALATVTPGAVDAAAAL